MQGPADAAVSEFPRSSGTLLRTTHPTLLQTGPWGRCLHGCQDGTFQLCFDLKWEPTLPAFPTPPFLMRPRFLVDRTGCRRAYGNFTSLYITSDISWMLGTGMTSCRPNSFRTDLGLQQMPSDGLQERSRRTPRQDTAIPDFREQTCLLGPAGEVVSTLTPVQYELLSLTEMERCLKTDQLAFRFHECLQASGALQLCFATPPPADVERAQQQL